MFVSFSAVAFSDCASIGIGSARAGCSIGLASPVGGVHLDVS